ncbi:MAG: 50S ribosomal protein L18 [Pirellulales bacterium]|nr:50S ribosomal protein L18 [Pirellulales bacterium]
MKHEKTIGKQRKRRGWRVRNRIKRNTTRPRLAVFRSLRHVYAQVIDDAQGRTLATASSLEKELREKLAHGGNVEAAQAVGQVIAQRALEAGVKQVAFDRREYKYHGRVAALADAARDAGLDLGAKAPEAVKQEKPKAKKGDAGKKASEKKPAGEKKPKASAKKK